MPKIGSVKFNRTFKRKLKLKLSSYSLISQASDCAEVTSINSDNNNLEACTDPSPIAEEGFHQHQTLSSVEINSLPPLPATGVPCQSFITCTEVSSNHQFQQTFGTKAPSKTLIGPGKTATGKDLTREISSWARDHNQTRASVTSLLKILKTHACFEDIPTDCRTLLQTPRSLNIVHDVKPGQYVHFPLKDNIQRILESCVKSYPNIDLQLNVDGLPISKSSSQQLWPILVQIVNVPQVPPFPVGIYFGNDKPTSSNAFLKRTCDDLINCKTILVNGETVNVRLHSMVCDAPARSFVLNVKGHTGYYGCQKCETEGDYFRNRMTFSGLNAKLRTNDSFRQMTNDDYHLGDESELLRLDVDIVKQMPLDYQHLICLGVMRKLLNLWVRGKIRNCRLSTQQTAKLSRAIINIKPFFPAEFPRKPRAICHLKNWKATEFRTFLLYVGPSVLKDLLPEEYYKHFLVLHCATTILCSPRLQPSLNAYAGELLVYFVSSYCNLYGLENVTYNVHNLIHIANDSSVFGVLDNFSTFKFENELGKIKRLLHCGNRPLEQVYNRLTERQKSYATEALDFNCKKEFDISSEPPNNVCLLTDNSYFYVHSIDHLDFLGYRFKYVSDLYSFPLSSTVCNINISRRDRQLTKITSSEIKGKALCYQADKSDTFVLYPLLHFL